MIVKEGTSIAGGKYLVEARLGKGGQAEVWKAQQLGVGGFSKDVVIKIVHAKALETPKLHEIFLNEAHLAAQLQHPNIVEIYDIGQHNELDYIVMELIRGQDLGRILEDHAQKTGQPIPWTLVAQMMIGVCKGLFHAHSSMGRDGKPLHLIHRDLKPENMILTVDGFIKIIDFGMAKASSVQHKTQTGVIKGTPSYMSPEQITARPQDLRSDLFALGIIMYELCTGQRPFLGDMLPTLIYAILENQPESLRKRSPRIPASFDQLVLKLLEKKPDDRFQDARQVQRALEQIIRQDAPAGFHRDSLLQFAQRYAQPNPLPSASIDPSHSEPLIATDATRPTYTPSPAPMRMFDTNTPNPMRHPPAPLHNLFPEDDETIEPTMAASLEELKKAAQKRPSSEEQRTTPSNEAKLHPHLPPGAVIGIPTEQTLRDTVLPSDEHEKIRQSLRGYANEIVYSPQEPNSHTAEPPPISKIIAISSLPPAIFAKNESTRPTEPNAAHFSNEETEYASEETEYITEAQSSDAQLPLPNTSPTHKSPPPSPFTPPSPIALSPSNPDLSASSTKKPTSPSSSLLDALSMDVKPTHDPLSFLDDFSDPFLQSPEKPNALDFSLASPDAAPALPLPDAAPALSPLDTRAPSPPEEQAPSEATLTSVLAVPDTDPPASPTTQTEQSTPPEPTLANNKPTPETETPNLTQSHSHLLASTLTQSPLHKLGSAELPAPLPSPTNTEPRENIASELAFQSTAPLIEGISPEVAASLLAPSSLNHPPKGIDISAAYHITHIHSPRSSAFSQDTSPPAFSNLYDDDESSLSGESTTVQRAPKTSEDDLDENPTNISLAPKLPSPYEDPQDEVIFSDIAFMSQGELPALSFHFEETPPPTSEEAATIRQGFSPLAGAAYDPNQPPPEYYRMMQTSSPSPAQQGFPLDTEHEHEHEPDDLRDSGGEHTVLDVRLLEAIQRRKRRIKLLWIGGNALVILVLVGIILFLTIR